MAVKFEDLDKTLLEWEKNFKKTSLAARKKSGSTFLDSVVDGTPQDTGETVSNWRTGRDTPPHGVIPPYFKGSKGSARNANKVAAKAEGKRTIRALKRVQNLYIVNNSPIVGILEAGFSPQAPRGNIVAIAVARALAEYKVVVSWVDGKSNKIDSDV